MFVVWRRESIGILGLGRFANGLFDVRGRGDDGRREMRAGMCIQIGDALILERVEADGNRIELRTNRDDSTTKTTRLRKEMLEEKSE